MVFSSPTFLFLFLPIFLAGYYLLPSHRRSPWMLAASWLFYGWWRLDFLMLLVASSLAAAVLGRRIAGASSRRRRRRLMAVGVAGALALLGYFKYFNFGVATIASVAAAAGGSAGFAASVWTVVLPVGISFYIFQIISYLVDVYRETAAPGRSVTDIAAYISLFPQLVAGPIVRYSEIAEQLVYREHSWQKFDAGARRFMMGLARKVLIADAVAPIADMVFAHSAPGLAGAWLGLLAYTLQIYFDFSAYSDMAIGLGLMIGFTFPENFAMPYHSRSITEFWRRWHMTLSAWLRDYLYIPLGGSRRGNSRTLVNLMTVMVLGGLWHGAAWTFVLWGMWHGVWLVAERVFSLRPGHLRTMGIVAAGWLLFRAESMESLGVMIRSLTGLQQVSLPPDLLWQLSRGSIAAMIVGVAVAAGEPWIGRGVRGGARHGLVGVLFLLGLLRMLAASYSPFLYFQF